MSVITLIMTDGRSEYLKAAVASLQDRVHGPVTRWVIHDDSGDASYRAHLRSAYPNWELIGGPGGRRGCCAAYASAWAWLARQPETWVFSTEDDFTYDVDIDLQDLMRVMAAHFYIAQMGLRRQPWGTEPVDGGFVAQFPTLYEDATDGTHHWLEHRRNWSNNPGLFRRALCEQGWPAQPGCEIHVAHALMDDDPSVRFGLWGAREDPPRVRHIGYERMGHSY